MDPAAGPHGIPVFLFTDIEGSTRLWESHPEAMREALARHDVLLHARIAACGGEVFKTVGDAFHAVFGRAGDALAAAIGIQRDLRAPWGGLELRVRAAIHAGEAERRDGDYFGPTLNRLARLLAVGKGGQILLSDAARALCAADLPDGVTLADLGEHRLRDLARPERLFEAGAPGIPSVPGPLRTLDAFRHNLPVALSSLVGREDELESIRTLLGRVRLVTLTGTGGSGKTRLALQVAGEVLDTFADGVWWVDLAPLSDPLLVPHAVAGALGLYEGSAGQGLPERVAAHLRPRRCLVVLDNCEHLVASCASLVQVLLEAAPHLHILATAREPLGVAGEFVYRVPSLGVPEDAGSDTTRADLLRGAATRLFLERAAAAVPGYDPAGHAAAIVRVCRRLDGIPLAIELAAARVKVLSVAQIEARLDDRFRLLTGGSRTALPRQQTLRALVDWSYNLLSPSERLLFERLSAFVGGWDLEAAEAVGAGEGIDEGEVLDLLSSLVDKNLVATEDREGEMRYHLLETLRQYGAGRLADRPDAAAVRGRHFAYYAAFARRFETGAQGPEMPTWLERMDRERANVRSALEWGLEIGATAEVLVACAAMAPYWHSRLAFDEGLTFLRRAVASPDASAHPQPLGRALLMGGILAHLYFRDDADEWLTRAEETADACGDARTVAFANDFQALLLLRARRLEAAEARVERARVLFATLEDRRGAAFVLWHRGVLAFAQGRVDQASVLYNHALEGFRTVGEMQPQAVLWQQIAQIRKREGDRSGALAALREASHLAARLRISYDMVFMLWEVEPYLEGRTVARIRLLAALEEAAGRLGMPAAFRTTLTERLDAQRSAVAGDPDAAAAEAEGRLWPLERVLEEALSAADT